MHLDLQLSEEQKKELSSLAEQFYTELETHGAPFPKAKTFSALKEALKAVIEDRAIFQEAREKSRTQSTLLYLSHEETAIRNLPWQTATEDQPLLAIAKSSKRELKPHQASVGYPLKVLVMVSSPEKVNRLNYEDEELLLLRAFSPLMALGLVQVHFTDDGSLEDLEKKLTENKYHILHYSGHGRYKDGQGTLALEDPITGAHDKVTAEAFNRVLAKAHRIQHRPDLVVLSACQTAQGLASDLSGVADTILTGGVPAVIAMSASILDSCATQFAAHLYAQLAQKLPLPDAFQEARMAVRQFEIEQFKLAERGLAPGQWLIPQLLLNEQVGNLVDPNAQYDTLDLKKDVEIISGERVLVELRVRPENYVFVGRRREKRQALQLLRAGTSVLLRGQGGVGKTALAEHLAIRLMASNPKIKVFTFSEKAPAAQSLLDQMQHYLTKDKRDFKIVSELTVIPKQTDKFFHLLGRVSEYCDPVFLFDNIESFQVFDGEKGAWVWHLEKHEDVIQLIEILDQQTDFPLIITGRYPIAEFPELEICNMNTVPFGDFFRKCHQLKFSELTKKLITGVMPDLPIKRTEEGKPPSFEDIARLLHQTFGGNYRALEFFDELYVQKGGAIFNTLDKLSNFEAGLNDKEIRDGVLTQMSENLILEELLSYLDEKGLDTLLVLAQFNIPVLPMAVGMQRAGEDRSEYLEQAVKLTLVEKQQGVDGHVRYYVTPLVQDWLKGKGTTFDEKLAGDYHKYIFDNGLEEDWLVELSEAFDRYEKAEAVQLIVSVGQRLIGFYYKIQQFRIALGYGLRTESIAKGKTPGTIYGHLGIILRIFGQLDASLNYHKKALEYDQQNEDLLNVGTDLNNISQIYHVKGDYNTALQYLEQSLKIHQEIGDRKGEGATLNNLATNAHAKGDYNTALQYLEQSLKIRQEIGDRKGEGATLNNISQIYHAKGDSNTTLQYLEQSLKIRQEIGDRQGEGTTLNNISQIYDVKGDYNTALQYLEQSLKIMQEIGDRKGVSTSLGNIGLIYKKKGNLSKALEYYHMDLEICQEIGDRQGEGSTLNNISHIYDAKGDYNTALQYLEQSLKIRQEIGDRKGEGTVLLNIGAIHYNQRRFEEAISFLVPAYQIFNQIDSPLKNNVEGYLNAIIQKIGKPRFQEILQQLNQTT